MPADTECGQCVEENCDALDPVLPLMYRFLKGYFPEFEPKRQDNNNYVWTGGFLEFWHLDG